MRKVLLLGFTVVLLLSAIPAWADNVIFSDNFGGWQVDETYPYPLWSGRLPIYWDTFYESLQGSYFDIGYEYLVLPPVDANDRKFIISQDGTTNSSDVWATTKAYYDVNGCTVLNISVDAMRDAELDPCMVGPVFRIVASYFDGSTVPNLIGEEGFITIDHNTPRRNDPTQPGFWITYDANLPVPAGAKLAKFTILNDSNGIANDGSHGCGLFDNFVVTDAVCVNRPSMDLNRDCKVDFEDFALFARKWHECGLYIQGSVTGCW